MKTLASILGHNDDVLMEKFKDVFPDPNIEAALIAMDNFALMQKKAKQLVHIYKPAHDSPLASAAILVHTDNNVGGKTVRTGKNFKMAANKIAEELMKKIDVFEHTKIARHIQRSAEISLKYYE